MRSAGWAIRRPTCRAPLATDMLTPTSSQPATADLTHRHARERKALWVALVLILVWGSNFSVQKMVFSAMSPSGFLLARYLLMPVAAALLLCGRYGLHWPRVSRQDLRDLLKLGIVGHLGRLLINAISQRDYALVQGATLFIAFTFVLINLVIDLLYAAVDPRISYERNRA